MTYTAVVLAGSRPGRDAFAEQYGASLKALIPIGGEPMVRRPVCALLSSDCIGSVIVMTQRPDEIAPALPSDARLSIRSSGESIASTMLALCSDSDARWPLLVTTADHALLDEATIDEFCAAAVDRDIAIGVVERGAVLRRLPGTRRTWLKFRGGAYTGANLFALRSQAVAPVIELWRSVEQDRKKGFRLISLLGPLVLLGVALRLLTIDQALNRLGAKFGLKVGAVQLSNPLAGVDVDKPEDHALAEGIIGGRA